MNVRRVTRACACVCPASRIAIRVRGYAHGNGRVRTLLLARVVDASSQKKGRPEAALLDCGEMTARS